MLSLQSACTLWGTKNLMLVTYTNLKIMVGVQCKESPFTRYVTSLEEMTLEERAIMKYSIIMRYFY